MRTIIVSIIILLISFNMYGQTDSIEQSIAYKKALSMEITGPEYSKIVKDWSAAVKRSKGYPHLQVNNDGKVQYSFIKEFPNVSKKLLYNRILEWLSVSYGIFPTYLYSNLDDGKIICSISLKVYDNTTSSLTYVISIKDNKILVNIMNLGYQVSTVGHYSGDTWIPDSSYYSGIDQVFPIILKEPLKWNYYLDLMATINKQLNNEMDILSDFLINYDSRYIF